TAIYALPLHDALPIWGMAGAAIATVIGQVVSAIIVVRYLLHFKTMPLLSEHFRLQAVYVKRTAQIGLASFFNQIAMMVVQVVLRSEEHTSELQSRFDL